MIERTIIKGVIIKLLEYEDIQGLLSEGIRHKIIVFEK